MPRQTHRMKTRLFVIVVVAAQFSLTTFTASAHPGSGIVVDRDGNVYFTHIGRGVGKIDPQGKLTYVGNTRGGHWMCLDADESFSRTQPRHFERITPDTMKPVLIHADGGSPIAVLRDGLLHYASNNEKMTPVGQQVTRQSPDERKIETVLKAEPPWSPTGVAVQRGEVYILEYTNANGSSREGWRPRVRRLGRDGKVTTLFTAEPEPGKSE